MESLFSPIGLAFIAWVYYLARIEGSLKFRLSGYDGIVEEWINSILPDLDPITFNMPIQERDHYRREAADKLYPVMSDFLSRNRFSRIKIHDLKKLMFEKIHLPEQPWKRHDIEDTLSRCFKRLISHHDTGQKRW